jgi:hypothetical protein
MQRATTHMSTDATSAATLNWVNGFVRFLKEATQNKQSRAFYDVMTLDASIGRRIGLGGGIKDKIPPFIGLQPFDMQWFCKMPWTEIILESSALVMIADPVTTGLKAPQFGIRIPINPDYANVLARFREIDVREMNIGQDGRIQELSQFTAMSLKMTPGKVDRLGYRPSIRRHN